MRKQGSGTPGSGSAWWQADHWVVQWVGRRCVRGVRTWRRWRWSMSYRKLGRVECMHCWWMGSVCWGLWGRTWCYGAGARDPSESSVLFRGLEWNRETWGQRATFLYATKVLIMQASKTAALFNGPRECLDPTVKSASLFEASGAGEHSESGAAAVACSENLEIHDIRTPTTTNDKLRSLVLRVIDACGIGLRPSIRCSSRRIKCTILVHQLHLKASCGYWGY